jgi:hypothetical protein
MSSVYFIITIVLLFYLDFSDELSKLSLTEQPSPLYLSTAVHPRQQTDAYPKKCHATKHSFRTAAANAFHYSYPSAFFFVPFEPSGETSVVPAQQLAASGPVDWQLSRSDSSYVNTPVVNCSTETGPSFAADTAKCASYVSYNARY